MLRLYTHPFSIFPRRIRIALAEKENGYELEEVDIFSSPAESAIARLNPFAQIPVLEDAGFVASESIVVTDTFC